MNSPERKWPPRNAREALLSSPNGRRKYEERRSRSGASPSPLKEESGSRALQTRQISTAQHDSEDEDQEDEETLQLKLQAIEAKLKLKRLQNKRTKPKSSGSNSETEEANTRTASRTQSALSSSRTHPVISRSKSTTNIQVPLSPERRLIQPEPQRSPGRVLLGIDKGLSARHVSLKRAPATSRTTTALGNPFGDARDISRSGHGTSNSSLTSRLDRGSSLSFSERMAATREARRKEEERRARSEKTLQERSAGFSVKSEELRKYESAAQQITQDTGEPIDKRAFTREEVLSGMSSRNDSGLRRSNSAAIRRPPQAVTQLKKAATREDLRGTQDVRQTTDPQEDPARAEEKPEAGDPALFEPFSSCNLSRRVLPHSFVKRTTDGMTAVTIPDLLKEVKAPSFALPDNLEGDFVLFAIVGTKSEPIAHKQSTRTDTKEHTLTSGLEAERSEKNDKGNFLILTLTDLKWTIDLFLFSTAYTRYRKLTPGTLIAILNPDIMPPQRHKIDTGRFSLKLSSSDETLLEIGTSKDLGWCTAVKKDGKACGAWVDKRLTSVCEFHSSVSIDKLRSGRMEVQGMSAPFGPGGRNGSWAGGGGDRGGGGGGGKWGQGSRNTSGLRRNEHGPQYSRESQSAYFYVQGQKSAASLIDADDHLQRGSAGDRSRQELARQEKERKIAQSLGMRGDGAGAEYLRHRGTLKKAEDKAMDDSRGMTNAEPRTAASLGLVSGKSKDVMLSPLKRKTSGGNDGTVKKKTRFVTSRGIREAGRESIGMESLLAIKRDGQDDDDLDIV